MFKAQPSILTITLKLKKQTTKAATKLRKEKKGKNKFIKLNC
jgi:hypothetical protein